LVDFTAGHAYQVAPHRRGAAELASTADLSGATIRPGRTQKRPAIEATMHIQISGQQIDIGDALRTHVTEKLQSGIAKYFDQPIDGTVTFTMDERIGGLMFPMYAKYIPSFDASFNAFAADLKKEAEQMQKGTR
jgi:ribosome-associated translation inhibitor RaiA